MGALKDLQILPLIHKHKTRLYFETGLGFGTGIIRAMQPEFGFDLLVSVEINPELVELESKFFRFDTRIKLFNSTSVEGLENLLPQIRLDYPIFFFLDAHFQSSDVVAVGGKQTKHSDGEDDIRLPLWNELQIIKKLRTDKGAKDVLCIDDLFLYSRETYFEDKVERLGPGAVPDYQRDWMPKFIELFDKTHKSKIVKEAQGTLILEPK